MLSEECKAIKRTVGIYIMLAHHVWHVEIVMSSSTMSSAAGTGDNNKSAPSRAGTE